MRSYIKGFIIAISLVCFAVLHVSEAKLPPDEVGALREIGESIGKTDWNFDVDPCSGDTTWLTPKSETKPNEFMNNITCDCPPSLNSTTVCHVTHIHLKGQSLSGIVPPNLVKLPFLEVIDLARNYLTGTIPPAWGSMSLTNISLFGNRITGSLPKELANISTLQSLVVDINQINGTIPTEFGNFRSIEKIFLVSNNLTGELPESLAKLSTLREFRISDNQFSGSIPNFILNWTNLERLEMQGSGLAGPFPLGTASWENLTDLRISDLTGNDSTFPRLHLARNLVTLILRSCNITGQLPDYLGGFTQLKTFDLSFNKLTGDIPSDYSARADTDFIFFTGNKLSGTIATWMGGTENMDLSYNNLSIGDSECQIDNLNLFASSSNGNTSGLVSCMRDIQCPTSPRGSLHIDCGGRGVTMDDGTVFEPDFDAAGPSRFFRSSANWVSSSTGYFLDDSQDKDIYTMNVPNNNSQLLYSTARLSPLSLTYYGYCLLNGNYSVNLHFEEIRFTDDRTYVSLGRRIFDVYIQGELVLKDFNIAKEAGGVKKPIVKNFTCTVDDGTLEIRFYWAGKGTTGIPFRGVYGPLISAISIVNPDAPVPSNYTKSAMSAGAISGIVVGVAFIGLLIVGLFWWKLFRSRKDTLEHELKGLDLHTGSFSLRQIKAATNNFDAANKVGEGGFGSVYKGCLSDGTSIAVKQLSAKSKQGNREFVNELGTISALQHPNLVKLHGCCIEGDQLLLVYEYLENNSLARALFGPVEFQINLDWKTRHHICIGIAKGLAYLHEESRLKIVHRDIKAANVLLDKSLNPKISDFGLAKLDEDDSTHINTRIAGTYGYMAPEYAMHGYLTDKADVYSFGVVALEIVSGKSYIGTKRGEDYLNLLDHARVLNETGNLMDLIDPKLGTEFNADEVVSMIKVALHCTHFSSTDRPSMSTVVSMLEGKVSVGAFVSNMSVSSKKLHEKLLYNENSEVSSSSNIQMQSTTEVQWTNSTGISADLYPDTLDSDYLQRRA